MKILTIFGTRPEAIKMAPLVRGLGCLPDIENITCVTGQHRQMLDQVMAFFELAADRDLNVMVPNQTLNGLFSRLMQQMDGVLEAESPDRVLVHGDTTTAAACALAAFHRQIPVAHVEAGLRTDNLRMPFPEEMNRRVIDTVSDWLFAPTTTAKQNLLRENNHGHIAVTGNTVIDALAMVHAKLEATPELNQAIANRHPWLDANRRLLLVTGHRRENFGDGFRDICDALAQLSRRSDVQIAYPVHLNPRVRTTVMAALGDRNNIHLIEPVAYPEFVWLMQRAHIILTDSGGVQEEAPSLGKPVLVMREVTERPEAVAAGTVILVGTNPNAIEHTASRLLDDDAYHQSFCQRLNPYGDGRATQRIIAALTGHPFDEFEPARNAARCTMTHASS